MDIIADVSGGDGGGHGGDGGHAGGGHDYTFYPTGHETAAIVIAAPNIIDDVVEVVLQDGQAIVRVHTPASTSDDV